MRTRLVLILLDLFLIFATYRIAYVIYRDSTGIIQLCDSCYALLVGERLLATGSTNLIDVFPSDPTVRQTWPGMIAFSVEWPDQYYPSQWPYHCYRHYDSPHAEQPSAVYYGYPLGTTFLSLPFLWRYQHAGGASLIRPDGHYDAELESKWQHRIASRVTAVSAAIFYVTLRFFLSPLFAFPLALGYALGSPAWSTLARSLWSHTWMVFWLSIAVVLCVGAGRGDRRERGWPLTISLAIALGTALFAMFATRPQSALTIGPILLYTLLIDRRLFGGTVATGLAWSLAFAAVNFSQFGTFTPPSVYEAGAIDGRNVLERFFWLMVSPSRGLLVYCPYLLMILAMLVMHRRWLTDRWLLIPSVLSITAYVLLFSNYNGWHGGSCYGPRYFSDLLPWFVLLSGMAVAALLRSERSYLRKALELAILLTTFAWGVWVHARGANVPDTWEWNYLAFNQSQEIPPKDWHHPQFLAGITYRVTTQGHLIEPP